MDALLPSYSSDFRIDVRQRHGICILIEQRDRN